MQLPLFFHENIGDPGTEAGLEESTARHVTQVLRMRPEENLLITDGRGQLAGATIVQAKKDRCTVRITNVSATPQRLPALTIAISLTKNVNRFEWFLEKATELGTAAIVPMLCERTEKQHARLERMTAICKSAMLQSRQSWMPSMHSVTAFHDVIASARQQQRLFGHIVAGSPKLAAAVRPELASHIILIGPEGDFSPGEVAAAMAGGFEGVSFGNTILRVETAGIFAAAVYAALT